MHVCDVCEGASPPEARYCMHCGKAVGTRTEEVRQITVLFADLVGSTGLISRSTPEEARALLDDVVSRLRAAVRHFGGTVVRVAGDGILALFGAPVVLEDHARRACLAALRMQADMASDPIEGPGGEILAIRVGIGTGKGVLRSVASDLHVEYTAEGVPTHIAAKLQDAARPGGVLVSEETSQLVDGIIPMRPSAAVAVRGMPTPLPAFELVAEAPLRGRFQAALERGLHQLVGRTQEFEWLEAVADEVDAGQLRVASVIGEAGVGKSRLLWEFGLRLHARGWRVIHAPATVNGTALAYYPVLVTLRNLYRIDADDSAAAVGAKLQHASAQHGLDIVPLRVLFGLPADESAWTMLDGRERQQRTQRALTAALAAASRPRCLLVSIEDFHHADAETLALAERMATQGGASRLLLLAEARPTAEGKPPIASAKAAVLRVEPLAASDARALLHLIRGPDGIDPALAARVIDWAAGNPFFIEESLRMLETAGAGASGGGDAMPIPGSVADVVEARIARLGPPERRVLQLASAVGRHAYLPILLGLCEGDVQELETRLDRLVEGGFLEDAGDAQLGSLRFRHAVMQEVAYAMMTRADRRGVHAAIVGLLESQALSAVPERLAMLGRHAAGAELWQQALDYLERAARLAIERAAPREAVRLLDEARGLLPRLDPAVRKVEQELDLGLALRGPLLALGNLQRVGEVLAHLETIAQGCGDLARSGRVDALVAGHRWLSGELRPAVDAGRRAIQVALQLGDFSLLVPARWYTGSALHELGEFEEAIALLTANVDSVPEHAPGHAFGMAGLPAVFCRSTRSWLHANLGDYAAAAHDAEDALRIGRASGNAFSILSGVFAAAWLHLERAEFDRAAALLEEGLALCERQGLLMWLSVFGSMQSLALAQLGERSAARALLERAVPDITSPTLSTPVFLTIARARFAMGEPAVTREVAHHALKRARKFGERIWEGEALALLGAIAAADDAALAESLYTEALAIAQPLGTRPLLARCHAGLAALQAQEPEALERGGPSGSPDMRV